MSTTNLSLSTSLNQPGAVTNPLTEQQQAVHDQLLTWYTSNDTKPAVFSGAAGTGKSWTLGRFVETIKNIDSNICIGVSAPTHKAVKVLRKHAFKGVQYRTVHSWLQLKEQIDHITGDVSYAPDKYSKDPPPIQDLDLLVLDEVSMLTDDLFNYLVPWVKKGLKVLFTGDKYQINPVKHVMCIPFLRADDWGMLQCNLTQVMRQKDGNPILEFATEIRNNQKSDILNPQQNILPTGEGIQLIQHASAAENEVMGKYFTSQQFSEDSDYMKVIAWRNVTVNKYNEMIRGLIYKDVSYIADIMMKEKLIMDRPFVLNARSILTKNEEVEVVNITTAMKQFTWVDGNGGFDGASFKFYLVGIEWFTDKGPKNGNIPIIHEESKIDYLKVIEKLKQLALQSPAERRGKMWKQYYAMIDNSAWVKYNYAITGHGSQGSSYDHALVLKWDIDYNSNIEERNRILYVACTRARNTLFIET